MESVQALPDLKVGKGEDGRLGEFNGIIIT